MRARQYCRIQGGKVLIVCSGIFYMKELGPAQTEAFIKTQEKEAVYTTEH